MGRARSLQELAKREGTSRHHIRRLVNLLSLQLVEAILQGQHRDAADRTGSAARLDRATPDAGKLIAY